VVSRNEFGYQIGYHHTNLSKRILSLNLKRNFRADKLSSGDRCDPAAAQLTRINAPKRNWNPDASVVTRGLSMNQAALNTLTIPNE